MTRPAICTIFAKNYLAHARVLTESFLSQHPDGVVYGLLCDRLDGHYDPASERFITLPLDALNIPGLQEMILKYSLVELSTAVKPFLLRHLFETREHDQLCYFDPDILFLSPLDEILSLLETDHLVVVPHLVEPLREAAVPGERGMLMMGAYNLGFIGLRRGPVADRFLRWWEGHLANECFVDPGSGLYVDQKWIDLAPGMFDGVRIHRDPGCDVAYWNLAQRPVAKRDGAYTTLGRPITFFHFSGYSPAEPERISKRISKDDARLGLPHLGDGAELFELYRRRLLANGFETASQWPYALSRFSDGTPITDAIRAIWREASGEGLQWRDPLDAARPGGFCGWLSQPADAGSPLITQTAARIYRWRPDVQKAYPDMAGAQRREFARWFVQAGATEHGIPAALVAPMAASLQSTAPPAEKRLNGWGPLIARAQRAPLGQRVLGSRLAQAARRAVYPPATPAAAPAPGPREAPADGVNVLGYLSAETGMGELARSLIRALRAEDYPTALLNLDNFDGARRDDDSIFELGLPQGAEHGTNLVVANADALRVVRPLLGPATFHNRRNIGFWAWELSRFPGAWRERFQGLDEVWVLSAFMQQAIGAASPAPVVAIGAPVVPYPPSGLTRADLGLPADRRVFLFAFDMLSVPERKNPLDCIAAFRAAFAPRFDGVQLVIKANHLPQFPDWQARLREEMASVPGTLIEDTLDRRAVNGLYELADVYVSLHRSEGFGLTLAESMRLGKPVIATDYSANRDYLNESNGFPVRYALAELERDYGPYQAGNVWAQPDVEHAAALMRQVDADPEEGRRRGRRAAADIERMYNPRAVARRMIERLRCAGSQPAGWEPAPRHAR